MFLCLAEICLLQPILRKSEFFEPITVSLGDSLLPLCFFFYNLYGMTRFYLQLTSRIALHRQAIWFHEKAFLSIAITSCLPFMGQSRIDSCKVDVILLQNSVPHQRLLVKLRDMELVEISLTG